MRESTARDPQKLVRAVKTNSKCSRFCLLRRTIVPGLTQASSDKSSVGLMRLFTRKTNKLQPKFEMTGEC